MRGNEEISIENINTGGYTDEEYNQRKKVSKKRKYIKQLCITCQGTGWYWGTSEDTMKMKHAMGGTDRITCINCNGTGIHKAEIIEEDDNE